MEYLGQLENYIWLFCIILIISFGTFLTIKSNFFQIRTLFKAKKCFTELAECAGNQEKGVHPIKLYFASVGGMIGIGNIVGASTAVTIGGPGALFWLWIASFLGMLVKYGEIYLGIKHRVISSDKTHIDGGPMYYLQKAFNCKLISVIFCICMFVYAIEIFQFKVITDTLVNTFYFNKYVAIILLIFSLLFCAIGGVPRLVNICVRIMPVFLILYFSVGLWLILDHRAILSELFNDILYSAWHGAAPIGGFVGSGLLLTMHCGIARAIYSGDIGIGYDSIIYSESKSQHPHRQARLAIFALLSDTLLCSISILIILVTGTWSQSGLEPSQYVAQALTNYIDFADYFIGVIFFIAGFTTLTGYLIVGQKCAKYINAKHGKKIFLTLSMLIFVVFSFTNQTLTFQVMQIFGGLLLIINLTGVIKLSKEIKFK